MNYRSKQPNYGPGEYEFNFDFNLDFSFFDYLLASFYVLFILPVMLVLHGINMAWHGILYTLSRGHSQARGKKDSNSSLSFISRMF